MDDSFVSSSADIFSFGSSLGCSEKVDSGSFSLVGLKDDSPLGGNIMR